MQRSFNWQNAQRVDVPHLRLVESAVTADFQLLAGQVLAGGRPVVVRGFGISVTGAVGNPAPNLSLITASGILLHPTAAESGSVFSVPRDRAPEVLNGSNAKVKGSFVTGTNYIGVDLVRSADASTSDTVSILSDATGQQFPKTLPLGRTLDYRIYVQTTDFDHAQNVLPVAVVVVDANGNVTSITDARQMAFRLGKGGASPAGRTPWTTLANRQEPGITADAGHAIDPFSGGDKDLVSLSDWMALVMRRMWEVGGGAYWYSPAAERDLKLNLDPAKHFSQTGENWYWDGTNLLWQGIRYVFANGAGGSWNKVSDQIAPSAGLTDLVDGECLYVNLDRTQNATALTAAKGIYSALTAPAIPGSRRVIAWREFGQVYVDGERNPVNLGGVHASTTTFGVAKLSPLLTGDSQTDAIVIPADSTYKAVATGMTNPGAVLGPITIGAGAYDNAVDLGGGTNSAPVNVKAALNVTGTSAFAAASFSAKPTAPSTAGGDAAGTLTTKDYVDAALVGVPIFSASSGQIFVNSTSYVDAANLTLNISTRGRPVVVCLTSDGSGNPSHVNASEGDACYRILRDGVEIASFMSETPTGAVGQVRIPCGAIHAVDVGAGIGPHTYKLQYKISSGLDHVAIDFAKLCAYEL